MREFTIIATIVVVVGLFFGYIGVFGKIFAKTRINMPEQDPRTLSLDAFSPKIETEGPSSEEAQENRKKQKDEAEAIWERNKRLMEERQRQMQLYKK